MLENVRRALKRYSSKKKAMILQGFFKTGPGEYGEGDLFLGVTVPNIRKVANAYVNLDYLDILSLLRSKIHEERLAALLILVFRFKEAGATDKKRIYDLYLASSRYINNWDLVDLTSSHIVGAFLNKKDKKPLYALAKSNLLWERRIAIVATHHYIKQGIFEDTLTIALILLNDKEDLIHKATGWMLREVGKRNAKIEEDFLRKHYKSMPRVMLRYAIERFPKSLRQAFLGGEI